LIIPSKRLTLLVVRAHERAVLRRLGELGVVHLKRLSEEDARRFVEEADKLKELEELSDRLVALWTGLARSGAEDGEDYRRYVELREKLAELRVRREELKGLLRILEAMERLGEEIPPTGRLNDLFSILVIIPREELGRLEEALSGERMVVRSAEISRGEALVNIIGLADSMERVEAALATVYHQEVSLPENLPKRCRDAAELVKSDLEKLESELKALEEEFEKLRRSIIGPSPERGSAIQILSRLREEASALLGELSPEGAGRVEVEELNVEEAHKLLEELVSEYREIKEGLVAVQERIKKLSDLREVIEELSSREFSSLEAGEYESLAVVAGILRIEALEDVRRRILSRPAALQAAQLRDGRIFIAIACLKEDLNEVLDILKTHGFEDLTQLLRGLPPDPSTALTAISDEVASLRAEEGRILSRLEEFKRRSLPRIAAIARCLELNIRMEEALHNTLRSEELRIIQGWVPAHRVGEVSAELEKLRRRLGNILAYRLEDPAEDEEVPTILRNPRLFKVYEGLVAQYGWPGHREIDPTIVSGILWTMMFGLMFPDAGQGLVIICMGSFLAYFFKGDRFLGFNARKLGRLMIGLGLSATAFGLILGEFFLMEFPPLVPGLRPGWLEDPSGAAWLLKVAIFFGIAQIILAMAIATWNEFKNDEAVDAILGHHGIAGLIAFAGFVLTAFHFLGVTVVPGVLQFPELGMGALMSWPFYVMLSGFAMMALKPVVSRESMALGFGGLLEAATSFLANTFSYARIAGFAITHAALALVVNRMMGANPLMGVGMGLILLNLFALSIELLVCVIQALRLLYYEFYSKFYRGAGVPYRPWRLL